MVVVAGRVGGERKGGPFTHFEDVTQCLEPLSTVLNCDEG